MNKRILCGAAAVFGGGLTFQAFAQGTPATPAPPVSSAQPAHLEEVIVTAARRKQNLQKTAIAVTAVSGATLEQAGVVQPAGLNKTVAGLTIAPAGPGAQVYLRGVGTFSADTFSSSPIAFNLDGVYLSLPAMTNGIFYDVSRVEVLKGPQGTLYGKNATAGAINVFTSQPTDGFNGYVSQEIGNYGLFRTTGAVNGKLTDTLSVRAAGEFFNRNGYYSDDTGRTGLAGGRLTALYKPNDDIRLTVGGDYQHTTGEEEPLVVFGANPANPWEGPTTAASNAGIIAARAPGAPNGVGLPPFFSALLPTITKADLPLRNDNAGVRAELDWNLGFANLSVLGSYRHLAELFTNDSGFFSAQTAIGHQATAEIRLASPTGSGKLKWQVGLYYFDNSSSQFVSIDEGFITPQIHYVSTDEAAAAFGEMTYSVTPSFRLTGGLRGTTETRGQDGYGNNVYTPAAFSSLSNVLRGEGVPPFLIPLITNSTLAPERYDVSNNASFRNISLKAGAEYDVRPNSLAYATFTTGFKSGGLNPDLSTRAVSNAYQPENLDAYEIGSKNRFLDNRLQLNADAFYWDYRNHQEQYLTQTQANPNVSEPLVHNIGSATVKGFDADVDYRPTTDDRFGAQLEYLDSVFSKFRYTEFTSLGYKPVTGCQTAVLQEIPSATNPQQLNSVNCDGKPFTRAPRWSVNLSYQHVFHLASDLGALTALVNTHLTTSQYLAVDYTPAEHEGGYTTTDLLLTYEPPSADWSLTGYVRNVENTASYTSAFQYAFANNVTLGQINPPRTFGGIFKIRF
jgi:iron complex outermembrane receptor protein